MRIFVILLENSFLKTFASTLGNSGILGIRILDNRMQGLPMS